MTTEAFKAALEKRRDEKAELLGWTNHSDGFTYASNERDAFYDGHDSLMLLLIEAVEALRLTAHHESCALIESGLRMDCNCGKAFDDKLAKEVMP